MRAIRVHQYGGPEAMRLEDLPTPAPGAGQVLVRIEAAGVNFIDVYQRTGLYKGALPVPLGLEAAGVVEAVGAGATGVKVGDRVAWTSVPGSYATHNLVPADRLVPLPAGVSAPEDGASLDVTARSTAVRIKALHTTGTATVRERPPGRGGRSLTVAVPNWWPSF